MRFLPRSLGVFRMRARLTLALVSAAVAAVAAGCTTSTSNGTVTVAITPAGPVNAVPGGAPTGFSAQTSNTSNQVTWTLTPPAGAGTISPNTGRSVIYTPPATASAPTTVTLTAVVNGVGINASVTINLAPSVVTAQTIPSLKAAVTVTYDSRDIPNISCQTQLDCFTVQGYLHARDRLFEMDFLRREAEGKLSEILGEAALSQDEQFRTLFTTPFSSPPGQSLGNALTGVLPADELAILQAYSNGANAYISAMQAGDPSAPFPAEYGQLAIPFTLGPSVIELWTPSDTMAIVRLFQFQLSETLSDEIDNTLFLQAYGQGPLVDFAKVNAWLRCQQPVPNAYTITAAVAGTPPVAASRPLAPPKGALSVPTFAGGTQGLRALSDRLKALKQSFSSAYERAGSNNWVVKGTSSASGASMVANDPHLPLQYPPLFHLSSLTSTDGLEAIGAAFPGTPGYEIGRSTHIGWGVTVVGYDVTDVYLETIDPTTGKVLFGPPGSEVSLIVVPSPITVRTGSVGTTGDTKTVPYAVELMPFHGPIVQQLSSTQLLSMRWVGLEISRCGATSNLPCNPLKAFLGLLTAANVDAAFAVLANYDTGAQNFVIADDTGNIGYDPHAFVPLRPWAGNAVNLGPAGTFNLWPWAALPGVGVAEWGDGTGNLWIPDAQLPQGKNPTKGYFATANAAPWAKNCTTDPTIPIPFSLGLSPTAAPATPYLSFAWDDATAFRASRIDARLAGYTADGGTVSLADMQSIQTDHVATIAGAFLPLMPAPSSSTGSYAAAMTLMGSWQTNGLNCPSGLTGTDPVASLPDTSGTNAQDSAACLLFHAFLNRLLVTVFTPSLAPVGLGVNAVNAIKAMLFMLTPGLPIVDQTFCAPQTCAQQAQAAMTTAYDQVSQTFGAQSNWIWGRVHTMTPASYGAAAGVTGNNYNPGPFARPGGAFTVDVGNPGLRADNVLSFPYGSGSNVRWIAVLDGSATKEQLPGPIEDGPFYSSSPGLLGQYVSNDYFDFPWGATAISASTVRTQTFSP
jgi:penicillin G amidase